MALRVHAEKTFAIFRHRCAVRILIQFKIRVAAVRILIQFEIQGTAVRTLIQFEIQETAVRILMQFKIHVRRLFTWVIFGFHCPLGIVDV